jgi:GNAT superfamily N-acetyltransferase
VAQDSVTSLSIVPANEASCEDLDAIFGVRGYPARCRCQRFKTTGEEWWWDPIPVEERILRQRQQTDCGYPGSDATSGLVAYVDGAPAGWCAVEPRSEYLRLGQTPWVKRSEDKADDSVWAVTCFAVRAGLRRQGLTYPLAAATVDFARERGARALEAYPMVVEPGQDVTWGELHVGHRKVFEAAGFEEVSHPSKRRVVMRIDFEGDNRR